MHSRSRHAGSRSVGLKLLAGLFALMLFAAACGDDDDTTTDPGSGGTGGEASGRLAELQEEGSITVGIANEVPYGYEDEDGNPTGEAPAVGREVLSRLGIDEMNAVVVEFGSLIPGLQAGRFDMIAAGMFINPERAEQILFSDPDYCATTAFAVEEGNPHDLQDFESFIDSDATLGVLSGAVEEGYAVDSGVPEDQIDPYPDTAGVFDALAAGRIDAVALTEPTVITQVEGRSGLEATEGFVPVIDGEEQLGCGGFGFVDQGLRDAFNEELNEMKDNDEILPLIEEFGFGEAAVEAAKDLTVEDLAGGESS
jgi:polar amino acid transport system substrate-binding protein